MGVLSVFFLNLVSLPAGDAIYLAANQPHAYLAGELMEVMATSDNVLRAGLTPKLRDTGVLCSSLTYSQVRLSCEGIGLEGLENEGIGHDGFENEVFKWWIL